MLGRAFSIMCACAALSACGDAAVEGRRDESSPTSVRPKPPRVIAKGVTLRSNPKSDEIMSMELVKSAMDSVPKDRIAQVMMLVSCRQRSSEGDVSWASRPDEIRRADREIASKSPIPGKCGEDAMGRRSMGRFLDAVPKASGPGERKPA